VKPVLVGMGDVRAQPGGLNRYVDDLSRALAIDPVVCAPEQPLLRRLALVRSKTAGAELIDGHFALYTLPAIWGRRVPLVVHFHGPWADESSSAGSRGIGLKRAIERRVYRRARTVITLSQAFADVAHERYGIPRERIVVVPPGVDLDRFAPRNDARARLGLPTDRHIVLAVRRLVPRMGLDVLLDAVTDDELLVIVGDGPERARLESRAGANVRFIGRVLDDQLPDWYRAADVSVVPSIALEGFGLSVLESLACGTPVIVSDVAGLPEAVSGLDPSLVVQAGDATSLRARLGGPLPTAQDCRAHAERFTWAAAARRHEEIYAAALRPKVVFVDHTAKLSGGELALLRLLPRLDVDPLVVLGEEGPLADRLRAQRIAVQILPFSARSVPRAKVGAILPALAGALYAIRLARLLRRVRPDLVHTNSLKAALYGGVAGRLARVPVLWHVRDRLADDYLPPRALRLAQLAARVLPSAAIANSQATAATLPEGLRTHVIASPVEMTSASSRNGHAHRIAIVGRIAPWKGQDVFLRAFASAFPASDERAIVVGAPLFGASEEEYERGLHRLARELGIESRVEFRGFREDVGAELAEADVLVHASVIPEPFGQVIVEGMAAGVPVVASRSGGPAEVIDDERDGLLYEPGNVDALASILRRVTGDAELRALLVAGGREKAATFAPELIAKLTHDVYRELLRR
jgi:glycosyltransferase involved in cell wall biosynthesis